MHNGETTSTTSNPQALTWQLSHRCFGFNMSVAQTLYYSIERELCHWLLRRKPPKIEGPNLLNLGCGPHIYPGRRLRAKAAST